MPPEDVLEIAENPDVPSFLFGSEALQAWTQAHVIRGQCVKHSGYYVVIHPSLNPQVRTFRVLSCWTVGQRVPQSWDVDDTLPPIRKSRARPSKEAWQSFVARYGEHEARRKLRWVSRPLEKVSAQAEIRHHRVRREGLSLVADLVHRWPGLSPMEARKKFASLIRDMLRVIRERRERIRELCAPGVSRQALP